MVTSTQTLLQSWSPPIAVNVALCLAILVYARGWIRLHAAFPKLISAWRLAAFVAGVAGIWLAIGSPLEAFDEVSLTVHMVQHLLLMSFSPPLILLGWPALPLLHGLPQWVSRSVIGPVSRSAFIRSLAGAVTHPLVCWLCAGTGCTSRNTHRFLARDFCFGGRWSNLGRVSADGRGGPSLFISFVPR